MNHKLASSRGGQSLRTADSKPYQAAWDARSTASGPSNTERVEVALSWCWALRYVRRLSSCIDHDAWPHAAGEVFFTDRKCRILHNRVDWPTSSAAPLIGDCSIATTLGGGITRVCLQHPGMNLLPIERNAKTDLGARCCVVQG